jgi:hypothetical protein
VLNGSLGERVPKILICTDGGSPDLACAAVQIGGYLKSFADNAW